VPKRDCRSYSCRLAAALGLCALVAAASGAATGSVRAIPACQESDYSIELGVWNVRGNVLVAVGVLTNGAPVCRLGRTVRLGVKYHPGNLDPPHGPLRPVRGNPTRWTISRVLHPWSQVVHTWTWRNWCRRPRSVFVFLDESLGAATDRRATRVAAPACRNRRVTSRFADTGYGTRLLPFTGDRIPARVLSHETPIPVSPTLIRVQNAWLVSDGRTLVAVYAGEAGEDPAKGRFVVIRQSLVFGIQSRDVVPAGHDGAVKLTRVPHGRAVETSAQHADLSFASAGGKHGFLRLAGDRVVFAVSG